MAHLFEYARLWASILSLGFGTAFLLIGAFGMLRLPDVWSRLHAAGMIDTAGVGLLLLGLVLHAGLTFVSVKLVLAGIFILVTSPVATHAIARAAFADGLRPQSNAREKMQAQAELRQ